MMLCGIPHDESVLAQCSAGWGFVDRMVVLSVRAYSCVRAVGLPADSAQEET